MHLDNLLEANLSLQSSEKFMMRMKQNQQNSSEIYFY